MPDGRAEAPRTAQAVAGRGPIQTDNVAGAFASQNQILSQQAFHHITVSNPGAAQLEPQSPQRHLKTQIGHQCTDHGVESGTDA